MKKKILAVLMATMMSVSIAACGSSGGSADTETTPEVAEETEEEPLDLTGTWTSSEDEGSYQEATISENTIEINWISDAGATKSIYWIGTYSPPTENLDEYSWTSERDVEKTASALLASSDDTKNFTYKDGKITYEVSVMGTTTTYELSQTSDSVPDNASTEKNETSNESVQQGEPSFEVTYQNVSFHTDAIGTIWSQAMVAVKNTSNDDLYLNPGSYELTSSDGTIIHTTSNIFTPYPDIISPNETGYYYEEVMMDAGTPTEGINITPHIDASISQLEKIRLEVSNTAIYDKEMGGIDLHGKIKNTTDSVQEYIYVAAILFDGNNQPIGQLWTVLTSSLQPGEEIGFELEPMALPENITTATVANYEVYAYPQQFQF